MNKKLIQKSTALTMTLLLSVLLLMPAMQISAAPGTNTYQAEFAANTVAAFNAAELTASDVAANTIGNMQFATSDGATPTGVSLVEDMAGTPALKLENTGSTELSIRNLRSEHSSELTTSIYFPTQAEGSDFQFFVSASYARIPTVYRQATTLVITADGKIYRNGVSDDNLVYDGSSATEAETGSILDKWITISQKFESAYVNSLCTIYQTITLKIGEQTFTSGKLELSHSGNAAWVTENTIMGIGLYTAGTGTVYYGASQYDTYYSKLNIGVPYTYVLSNNYDTFTYDALGDGNVRAYAGTDKNNYSWTMGNSTYYFPKKNQRAAQGKDPGNVKNGKVLMLRPSTAASAYYYLGGVGRAKNVTNLMPTFTSGLEIFETDIYIPSSTPFTGGTTPVLSLLQYPTQLGTALADTNASTMFSLYSDNTIDRTQNKSGTALSATYPFNEWFTLRVMLDVDAGSALLQMIAQNGTVTELDTIDMSAQAAKGFDLFGFVVPPMTSNAYIYLDDTNIYHLADEVLAGETIESISVTGEFAVDSVVTATAETTAEAVSYQWYRIPSATGYSQTAPTAIEGATSQSYTIQEEDKNHFILVEATTGAGNIPGLPGGTTLATTASPSNFVAVLPYSEAFDSSKFTANTSLSSGNHGNVKVNVSDTSPMTVITQDSRGKVLQIADGESGTPNTWFQNRILWGNLNKDIVRMTMDLCVTEAIGQGNYYYVQAVSNNAENQDMGMYIIQLHSDGIYIEQADDTFVKVANYNLNEWFTLSYTLHPAQRKCDIELISEDATVTKLSEKQSIVGNIASALPVYGLRRIRSGISATDATAQNGGVVLFDNFALNCPESAVCAPAITETQDGYAVAQASLAAATGITKGAVLWLAVYDDKGILRDVTIDKAEEVTATCELLETTSTIAMKENWSAKAFLWNPINELEPIANFAQYSK